MADQGCESDSDIVSQIKLRSSDGEVFRVPTDAAKMSNTIKNMLDDLGCFDCSSQNEAEAIPLSRVHSYVLEKVISWMSHHCRSRLDGSAIGSGAAAAVAGVGVGADVAAGEDDFDREFLQIDQGTLLEIMLAANYLDIQPLLELCCRSVARMMKGKSPSQIRATFNVKPPATTAAGSSGGSNQEQPMQVDSGGSGDASTSSSALAEEATTIE